MPFWQRTLERTSDEFSIPGEFSESPCLAMVRGGSTDTSPEIVEYQQNRVSQKPEAIAWEGYSRKTDKLTHLSVVFVGGRKETAPLGLEFSFG